MQHICYGYTIKLVSLNKKRKELSTRKSHIDERNKKLSKLLLYRNTLKKQQISILVKTIIQKHSTSENQKKTN
jgi:hypothetical protein